MAKLEDDGSYEYIFGKPNEGMTRKYDNTDAEFKELERRRQQAEQERKRRELDEASKNRKNK